MVTPLKMKYSGGMAPKGVQSGEKPKIMKGAREAGEMYKKPGAMSRQGKSATDKSSGQSNPVKQSSSDKVRYTQAKQSIAYSNAEMGSGKCKFVC